MKDHSCAEFVRVLEDYRQMIRNRTGHTLRTVRADSDPCFTANRSVGGTVRNNPELQRYLSSLPISDNIDAI
jgi:hypothetical protein